ncbi:hypothetical protein OUZ56_029656 [Daphnia magna]|uniref:Uncharacterized protein n=1 Tax=Daphnia magna TaxID=35525 RepID=A0ABR0B7G0_9CRUS|nr:hypothetical protein OUZ56_029656 [Daphnia magna]
MDKKKSHRLRTDSIFPAIRNVMPKSSEFDMGANSIVVHFPLANDASSTADEVIYSSWMIEHLDEDHEFDLTEME